MLDSVEIPDLTSRIYRALALLRTTYRSNGLECGWYHYLDDNRPGATASAVGLMSFVIAGAPFEYTRNVLTFLRATQVVSNDPKLSGGWAIRTTGHQPVMEASGWIVRFLGLSRSLLKFDSPDVSAAYNWILQNQNADHGWGSLYGQASRTYLTCLALRALATLDPNCEALLLGQDWLLKNHSGTYSAWGPIPSSPPTVLHTGFVLLALAELGIDLNMPAIKQAYEWLLSNLRPAELVETLSQVEDYNIIYYENGERVTYQNSLPHFALPVAISALLRSPYGLHQEVVYRGLRTIVNKQLDDGYWDNPRNPARVSIWAIWPFFQALVDVTNLPYLRTAFSVTRVSNALVVRYKNAGVPLLSLLAWDFVVVLARQLLHYWSPLLLVLFVVGGLVLVSLKYIDLWEYVLSLFVPIVLVFIQLSLEHRGKPR